MNNFLFVSAENDAIANCKAGGMADVVRDVPRHIAENDDTVHVVVPSYGRLHHEGQMISLLQFPLRGTEYFAELYKVRGKKEIKGIQLME